jgi:DNA-binding response OmpR family regulator
MRTLLLIEDDLALLESIAAALGRAGYYVLTASSGVQALQMAADVIPLNLVILDVQLPPVDRLAICRSMRSRPEVQVLMFDRSTGIMIRTSGRTSSWARESASPSSVRRLLSCIEAMLSAPPGDRANGDGLEREDDPDSAPIEWWNRQDPRPRGARARRFPQRSPYRTHRPK